MSKNRNEGQVALAHQLMALGCPLDLQFFKQAENDSSRSLRIQQVGGVTESRVFDIESLGTGCVLDVEIVNDLGRGFYIRRFELELPWRDDLFSWLPDPRECDEKPEWYRFSGEKLGYRRDIVLNHYGQRNRKFNNGDFLTGLVLGQSPQAIPECYEHGEELHATFSVIDQFDNRHSADVVLYADRSIRLRPRRHMKPRRSLLSQRDQLVKKRPLRHPVNQATRPKSGFRQAELESVSVKIPLVGSQK